jgi:hypothetical protein
MLHVLVPTAQKNLGGSLPELVDKARGDGRWHTIVYGTA